MSEHTNESEVIHEEEWDTETGIKKIADFLRSRKGMPIRHAVELGKRVEYCKGEKLCSFLLEKTKNSRSLPTISSRNEAIKVGRSLIRFGYIHRSERDEKNRKLLTPCREHTFVYDGYYTWMYDGPKTLRNILTACLILGFLFVTCFPIWPMFLKTWVWYLSVTFLIVTFVFIFVRLFCFFIFWMFGFEFWILPNIFDDDLGFTDSFKPVYTWSTTSKKERYYRFFAIVAFILFCVWIHNQPTDFDEYMSLTKQFTEDIYSGKLLSEMSQKDKEDIDKVRVPDLEDLMKDEDHDMFSERDEDKIFDEYMEKKYFSSSEDKDSNVDEL